MSVCVNFLKRVEKNEPQARHLLDMPRQCAARRPRSVQDRDPSAGTGTLWWNANSEDYPKHPHNMAQFVLAWPPIKVYRYMASLKVVFVFTDC